MAKKEGVLFALLCANVVAQTQHALIPPPAITDSLVDESRNAATVSSANSDTNLSNNSRAPLVGGTGLICASTDSTMSLACGSGQLNWWHNDFADSSAAVTPRSVSVSYASPSGLDSNDGSSWETAKKTIYAALEALPGGATNPPSDSTHN